MAYGFVARNGNDEVVIDNTLPTMGVKRRFTKSSSFTDGGIHFFNTASGSIALSGTEILVVRPASGQWVSPQTYHLDRGEQYMASNQGAVDCIVLDQFPHLPAPSGYGAVVMKPGGDIMWSSRVALGYIREGFYVPRGTLNLDDSLGWSKTYAPGNAFAVSGGGIRLDLEDGDGWSIAGEPSGGGIKFSYRRTYEGPSIGSPGYATYQCDLSGVIAEVS